MNAVDDWLNDMKIGVAGPGHVGLPLGAEFGRLLP